MGSRQISIVLGTAYKWSCIFPWACENTPTQLCIMCVLKPSSLWLVSLARNVLRQKQQMHVKVLILSEAEPQESKAGSRACRACQIILPSSPCHSWTVGILDITCHFWNWWSSTFHDCGAVRPSPGFQRIWFSVIRQHDTTTTSLHPF